MKQLNNNVVKVAIALSGGVDSAVAAKILKDEGYEIIGLFLKLWSDPSCEIVGENRCCDYEALEDARKVATSLDIPFYVVDAKREFKKEVVDYFINEYKSLRTPNPCVVCNEKIKFDLLLKKALSIGCDYLATGHYARITKDNSGMINDQISISKQYTNSKSQIRRIENVCHPEESSDLQNILEDSRRVTSARPNQSALNNESPAFMLSRPAWSDPSINKEISLPVRSADLADSQSRNDKEKKLLTTYYSLLTAIDPVKDQSYNLYRLNQSQLSRIIFPLGEMTKKEVRALAVKWNLPVKEKAESQEICFFGDRDYRDFLRRYLPESYFELGDIVDTVGNVIGQHEGLIGYTVGQRKGVDQKLKNRRTKELKNLNNVIPSDSHVLRGVEGSLYDKKPLYVIGFNLKKNQLIVGENEEVFQKEMNVSNLSWINPLFCHSERLECFARSRGIPLDELSVKIRSQSKPVGCKIQLKNLRIEELKNKHGVIARNEANCSKEIAAPLHKGEWLAMTKRGELNVIFDTPQRAVTPGQSVVFYCGDEVLGGGTIES